MNVEASRPADDTVSRQPVGRVVIGLLLVMAGVAWLAERAGWIDLPPGVLLPLAVTVVGIALIVLSFEGAHPGLISLGVALAVLTAFVSLGPAEGFRGGVGDRGVRLGSVDELESPYRLGVGSLTVDLSELEAWEGVLEVEADVGIGELRLLVPSAADVTVRAEVGMGEAQAFRSASGGIGIDRQYRGGVRSGPKLVLDAEVLMGRIEVEER